MAHLRGYRHGLLDTFLDLVIIQIISLDYCRGSIFRACDGALPRGTKASSGRDGLGFRPRPPSRIWGRKCTAVR